MWRKRQSVLGSGSVWSGRLTMVTVMVSLVVAFASGALCWDGGSRMTYSLLPRADYIIWDDDVGLEDAYFYGGEVAANLDRFVTLRGYYLTNSAVATDLLRISPEFIDQDFGITNYGGDLVLNLSQGMVVPFLKLGAGILRFRPDSADVFNQIALRAGGGLRYEFMPNIYAEVSAQNLFHRIDRTMLSAHDPEEMAASDPDANKMRSNLALSAALGIDLGGYGARTAERGRMPDQGLGERFIGATWVIEPFSGRLRFDDPSDLGDFEIVGGRMGTNITQNMSLSGYYWRGMKKGYGATEPLQSYGGEARFFLGRGQGAVPYLLMGAGKLDFLSDFRDLNDRPRSDKALLIAGAGIGFKINDYLRLNVDARDYMLSERDLDEIGSYDDLRHSLAVTGGLSFILGGGRGAGAPLQPEWMRRPVKIGEAAEEYVVPAVKRVIVAEGAEPAAKVVAVEKDIEPEAAKAVKEGEAKSYISGKTITIPTPSVGEIYIRYGEPGGLAVVSERQAFPPQMPPAPGTPMGGLDREALRQVISDEVARALREHGVAVPESAAAGQTELLAQRIADALERRLETGAPAQPGTIIIERPQEAAPQVPQAGQPVIIQPSQPAEVKILPPSELIPARRAAIAYTYTGVNLDDPTQWLFGARFDASPMRRGSKIWIVPEVEFGLFNKGSLMLAANAQYDFDASVKIHGKRITPYLYAGAGLLHFGKGAGRDRNEAVINVGYGVTFDVRKLHAYVEHQGVDLFSLHRLLFGFRWMTSGSTN